MRVLLSSLACLSLYSCSSYKPAPLPIPEGIYQGFDSALYVHDKYTNKMFGGCIDVKKNNEGNYFFFNKDLKKVNENVYKFDYVTREDYGVGLDSEIHYIHRVGVFTFTYNHLIVEYSVGDSGQVASQYKFSGWR